MKKNECIASRHRQSAVLVDDDDDHDLRTWLRKKGLFYRIVCTFVQKSVEKPPEAARCLSRTTEDRNGVNLNEMHFTAWECCVRMLCWWCGCRYIRQVSYQPDERFSAAFVEQTVNGTCQWMQLSIFASLVFSSHRYLSITFSGPLQHGLLNSELQHKDIHTQSAAAIVS